jgi:hypothetical protein
MYEIDGGGCEIEDAQNHGTTSIYDISGPCDLDDVRTALRQFMFSIVDFGLLSASSSGSVRGQATLRRSGCFWFAGAGTVHAIKQFC